jgi:hypothetical protein
VVVKKITFAVGLLIFSLHVSAGDFATCILEKMPGTANGATQGAIYGTCRSEYPGGYFNVKRGSGRGIFGFKNQDSCVIKKAKDTPLQTAAGAISFACHCLYKEPTFEGEMCDYPPMPSTPFSQSDIEVSKPAPPVPAPPQVQSPPFLQYTPPVPQPPTQAEKDAILKQQRADRQSKADLDERAARAIADYPFLDTPAGAETLKKIIDYRDAQIKGGTYPAIALTRAVNKYAPGNDPRGLR